MHSKLFYYSILNMLLRCFINRMTDTGQLTSEDELWQQQGRCLCLLFANFAGFVSQQVEFMLTRGDVCRVENYM